MNIKSKVIDNYNGKDIIEYTLTNKNNVSISILNLGGIITNIATPDRNGNLENIVLSFEDFKNYYTNPSYYGAIIGRTAGRIDKGEVTINGKRYKLNKNYGVNSGHGGNIGFDKKIWDVKEFKNEESLGIELSLISKALEENYPGDLNVKVIYELNNKNEFFFKVYGETNEDTLMNITNHSYFNLSGNYKRDILNHSLKINSDNFLEIDENGGATGKIIKTNNTPFDFNEFKKISKDINSEDEQIKLGNGYDHPFLLNEEKEIILKDEESGRVVRLETSQESVVVYSMNYYNDLKLKGDIIPKERMAICLETQAPPIGYNEAFKEMSYLKKEDKYYKYTKYTFLTE
ncbi:aldose epimerase family protein [Clostridium baratii]|uniref:aldose epimerase family protein n=1 Tax=Clostridium baratii TaxID=1561 RepID=UPI0030D5EC38